MIPASSAAGSGRRERCLLRAFTPLLSLADEGVGFRLDEASSQLVTWLRSFDVFTRIPHASFPGGTLMRMPVLVTAMAYYRIRDLF